MNDKLTQQIEAMADEIQPQRDLWPQIQAQLSPQAATPRSPARWPLALAASFALMVLTATVTWQIASHTSTGTATQPALASLLQVSTHAAYLPSPELISTRVELIAALQANWSQLPPDSQQVVADNLLEIRRSLDAIAAALAQDPDNASLQQLLHTTYEQELEMLANLSRATYVPPEVEI